MHATRPRRARLLRALTRLAAAALVLVESSAAATLLAAKKGDPLPWSVEVQVRWGTRKNREAYRGDFERAVVADFLSKGCFHKVAGSAEGGAKTDLVLYIQINEFITEQEYDSPETMLPGQGEEHNLLSARASVNLDYWLYPQGDQDDEIASGHIFREIVRQPQTPTDDPEQRAIRDLRTDASRWVVRDVCDQRGRLIDKTTRALASPPKP